MLAFYFDEDAMKGAVVDGLRARGVAVLTTSEAQRLGHSDESQLTFASAEERAIFTANGRDFARLHGRWLRLGRHHAGIVILPYQRMPVGAQVRALARLAAAFEPANTMDRLEFLSNWIE